MENEQNNMETRNDDGILRQFEKEIKKIRGQIETIETRQEQPIEARCTKLEARVLALEEVLTQETPTGRIVPSRLTRIIRRGLNSRH